MEPPSQVIERFRRLFIEGTGYYDQEIWLALEKIILSRQVEQEFPFFFNRCCHILINHWQMQRQQQGAISQLVALLENQRTPGLVYSRVARRLRQLLKLFTETEQYLTLRRRVQVISQGADTSSHQSKPLGTLIRRYPYLYEHCLLSEGSSDYDKHAVWLMKVERQRQFEFNLSQYVNYQVQQALLRHQASVPPSVRRIQPVQNPTLLGDRELGFALKQFVGKVEGSYTYRDLAHRFVTHIDLTPSYKVFKEDFYEYLTYSINPAYGKGQFNERLYTHLKNIFPSSDSQKPDELLIIRTCSQTLSYLVVESPQRPNHFVFVDLITNLGPTSTTGLLLKILLICYKVKPFLEKRFSILFNHYESVTGDGVPWLVASLENVNLAFGIHFGNADVSDLQQLM